MPSTMFAAMAPAPPRTPVRFMADAEIIAHDDGSMMAAVELANRTARPARMWVGGEAVLEPVTVEVRGNGRGSIVVPVQPGTLEVHHEGPSGSAIMVGEVPNPYSDEGAGPEEDTR